MALHEDRIAVVTGGSSGIGRGIALSFAEHGATGVVIADIRAEPKEDGLPTHEKITKETETEATFVNCDVSNHADLAAAIDEAHEFGDLNVMVNNAGNWHPEEFLTVEEEEYQQMMDISLKGAYFGSHSPRTK